MTLVTLLDDPLMDAVGIAIGRAEEGETLVFLAATLSPLERARLCAEHLTAAEYEALVMDLAG